MGRSNLWKVLTFALVLTGCSSEGEQAEPEVGGGAGPAGAAGAGAQAPGDTDVADRGTGAAATEGTDGAATDDGSTSDAPDVVEMAGQTTGASLGGSDDPTQACDGFIIDEGTFTVQPGEDVDYCVRVAIPPEYRDRDLVLRGWNWDLSTTHHYFMEHSPNEFTSDAPEPCDADGGQSPFSLLGSANDEGSTIAFGAGEGQGWTMMKDGYGKFLPANGHFRTSHHVINFTDEPMEISAKFKVCVDDADAVDHPMNSLVCTTTAINVPGSTGFARSTCTATEEIDVMLLASHGHQHLTRFTIQLYDGQQTEEELLYESFDWDSPDILALQEPLRLQRGQGLTYTCHYEGTGPVIFQDNATDPRAEHCAVFTAYAYPPDRAGEVPPRMFNVGILPNQVSPVTRSLPGSPI